MTDDKSKRAMIGVRIDEVDQERIDALVKKQNEKIDYGKVTRADIIRAIIKLGLDEMEQQLNS